MRIILFFLILLFLNFDANCQSPIITTIAGTGRNGHTGDGGPSTAADINLPYSIALDDSGNYFFVEGAGSIVRKVSRSGIITTIAGTLGSTGYGGDGGPATAAIFNYATDILYSNNILFIAEANGARIRKVDLRTNIISTYAGTGIFRDSANGGPATAASFPGANSMCFDNKGNIYFTSGEGRIKKIDTSTRILSNYAGVAYGFTGDGGPATAANLGSSCIAWSKTKNIVFTNSDTSCRVRRIDTNGIVTTIAGRGSPIASGDGGPAILANQAGNGIAIDEDGNIALAESNYWRIRMIGTNDTINTIVGTGVRGLSGDGGPAINARIDNTANIAFDKCDNLYIPQGGMNSCIRKVTNPNGGKPVITIHGPSDEPLCYRMPITFTSTTKYAGFNPIYKWQINGVDVGSSADYTYTPNDGDTFQCILRSDLYCVINPFDTSNIIIIHVDTLTAPSISISGTSTAYIGSMTSVTATLTGTGGSSYQIKWYNRGNYLATTTGPILSYLKQPGTDTITARYISTQRNCYDSVVSNAAIIGGVVSVDEVLTNKATFDLYPNPTESILNIVSNTAAFDNVVVLDLLGNTVYKTTYNTISLQINMQQLPKGVYIVRVSNSVGVHTKIFSKL